MDEIISSESCRASQERTHAECWCAHSYQVSLAFEYARIVSSLCALPLDSDEKFLPG